MRLGIMPIQACEELAKKSYVLVLALCRVASSWEIFAVCRCRAVQCESALNVDDMNKHSQNTVIQRNGQKEATYQCVSLSNQKSTSLKSANLNSESHTDENQICSLSELIPMKCNSSKNIQDVPSFDVNCKTSTATKILNTDLSEIEGILGIEMLSPVFCPETKTSFDTKQEVEKMEIDSYTATLTTNDQQFKLCQNKEAININVYKKQIENISNEGKCYKKEKKDCTPSLYSTNLSPDLDKTKSSARIDGKIISSCLYEYSDKLANDISTGCEDSLSQPLRVMADGDSLTFSTHNKEKPDNCVKLLDQTVLVGQNYDFEESLSNEANIKCKENNEKSTTFSKQIEDSYKDSDAFSPQCENISSTSHSSGSSNMKEFSVERPSPNPSTSIQESNLINGVTIAFLENQGRRAFTIQDVVKFVMEELNFALSYLVVFHSATIILKSTLSAGMLKIYNGKYVIKSSITFFKQSEDIAYDIDKDSDRLPQQCEEISSTSHSPSSSNMKEFSVKQPSPKKTTSIEESI